MRRTKEMQWRRYLLAGMVTICMVLLLSLFAEGFSIVSRAESAAKVIAASANIRKEPNPSSETIGSTERDKVISIKSQVQGTDGYTWYEVYVDANTLGYIRSDLVQITDGTTPPSGTAPSTPASAAPTQAPAAPTQAPAAQIPDEPLVDVTAVNPASASVTGGESVRIRQNASTTSRIVNTVKSGMELTITGTAAGTDGKTWYQVTFLADGAEVTGFIRSDFTTVKPEELTPYTEEPPAGEQPSGEEPPVDVPEPVVKDPYDVIMQDGEWGLVDYEGLHGDPNKFYVIQTLFDGVTKNKGLVETASKTMKTQKIIIIILVILLVSAAAVITLLIFKVKDMSDAQYFNEVENETIKRRSTRPQGGGQKVMQTVGSERQGSRAAGAHSSGAAQGQKSQGSRPSGATQGQKPQSQKPQGQRPLGAQAQRPQGGRPSGASQSARSAGAQGQSSQTSQSQQRPVSQAARPSGSVQGQQRPAAQGQRPQGNKPAQSQQSPGWQAKNFMADDEDEFEFEFLNYDGDDQN